jgi:hypothetical protein
MTTQQKQQAVATAADRLEAIEAYSRRSFITLIVIAHITAIPAFAVAYGALEYMRIKSVVAEAQTKFAKGIEDFHAAPSPARKPIDTSDLRDAKAELAQLALNTRAELEKTARDIRTQYERNAMAFDLTTKKQFIKFYEDTAKDAAADRVQQEHKPLRSRQ